MKKLILLGMAVAAFAALAIPAVASAAPRLYEGSTALGTNAQVIGVSHNAITTNTALGTLECNTVTVNAKVTNNDGVNPATGVGTGAETAVCNASGEPLNVTEPTLVHLESGSVGSGSVELSFIADVGPFECAYAGAGAISYVSGGDSLKVLPTNLASPAEFCEPEEGNPVFSGDFTVTTENGTVVTVK